MILPWNPDTFPRWVDPEDEWIVLLWVVVIVIVLSVALLVFRHLWESGKW